MKKSTLFLGLVTLASLGWAPADRGPFRGLKEETMTIEYNLTENEAVVRIKAETEHTLEQVEVRRPDGRPLVQMDASAGERLPLSGFELESREVPFLELLDQYPEGTYEIRGTTSQNEPVRGRAYLSHSLIRPPAIIHPRTGDVDVVGDGLQVRWAGASGAAAYEISLEQDDNDGLTATLDGRSRSFEIPSGILRSRTETYLEVTAISPSGNRTAVEVVFTTR